MGNSEEGKPCKPEKPLSPAMDQNGVHVYPDWAMMQAYYGPQYAVPPYLNSAVASPHNPPPYMWMAPQSMIPPYGMPYGAFYAHGGIYGHPGVPIASPAFSTDVPVKSSGDQDGGSMKKSKDVDGLANSIGNGNAESGENGTDHRLSESDDTDNSSDGSNGVTVKAGQRGRKRQRPGSSNSGGRGSESTLETSRPTITPATAEENMDTALELKDPSILNVKPIAIHAPRSSIASETWFQDERELKQERRKQSNRESARRSRLRKQAEAEELATKVHTLTTENTSLKSKIREFMEISKKLNLENAKLMEKINDKTDDMRLGTANLLSRVNDNDHNSRANEDGESYEKRNSGAKFHQLLDAIASPRSDAVAAN